MTELPMEVASLAIDAVALARLLINTIDCFELVQLGRTAGRDVQTNVLKLDNCRLRFSRCGESIGLSGSAAEIEQLMALTPRNVVLAAEERM